MRKIQTLKTLKESREVTERLIKPGQNCTMRSFTGSSFLTNWIRFLESKVCTSWEQKSSKEGEQLCLCRRHEENGGRLWQDHTGDTALICCLGSSTKTLSGGTENGMAVPAEFITGLAYGPKLLQKTGIIQELLTPCGSTWQICTATYTFLIKSSENRRDIQIKDLKSTDFFKFKPILCWYIPYTQISKLRW